MDPSPLAQSEAAKAKRDLDGEMSALTDGERSLHSASWYPARLGDLLTLHYSGSGAMPDVEETYAVVTDGAGSLVLELRSHTYPAKFTAVAGAFAPGLEDDPFFYPWMEAGPGRMLIVRDDWVIHGSPRG